MRQRAWGLLVLVPAAVFVVALIAGPYTAFHVDLSLAGTPDRFAATVVRAGRSDTRAALWLDNVFIVAWMLTVPRLLHAGLVRWAPERRRSFGVWRATPVMAALAGALDLAGNVLSLAMVGKLRPPTAVVLTVTTMAWVTWLCYLVSLVGLLALVIGPLLAPVVRRTMRRTFGFADRLAGRPSAPLRAVEPPVAEPPVPGSLAADDGLGRRIGICVSGGGVRASAVAIGALRRFDTLRHDGPSLFARSSWLVAVGGGAHVAGGWRVAGERRGTFDATHDWAATVRRRRRFLDNGSLSIVGGVLNALGRSVLVMGGVFALVHVVSAALGRSIDTRAIHYDFPFVDVTEAARLDARDLVPMRLVLPGLVMLLVAAGLAIAAYSRSSDEQRSRLTAPAVGLAIAGATLLGWLVAVPIVVVYGRRLLDAIPGVEGGAGGATLIVVVCGVTVVVAVLGALVARRPRPWLRVGGAALALAVAVYAVAVVAAHAYGEADLHPVTSWPVPGTDARVPGWVLAVVWLVVLECIPAHRLSLGGMFRKRLAATFAPVAAADELEWGALPPASPQLAIVATAHASSDTFCGLPGYGMTFRADRVTLHDRTDGSSASVPAAAYPTGTWWDGFPRAWTVTRTMSLGDVAFGSAVGRRAWESGDSLLAVTNLRLGAWVPNPRFAHWFNDPATAPRVHLGYLVKELFGRYRPDRDAFVYVTDGSRREALGLVELLRQRPDVVCCLDAAGDPPGSFRTLSDAVELALVELGVDVDIDLARLRSTAGFPLDCAAEGLITYPDALGGGTGRLLYGRCQLSETAAPSLLQHGARDDRFPDLAAAGSFLPSLEYDQLVALGEHVGERIVRLFDGATP